MRRRISGGPAYRPRNASLTELLVKRDGKVLEQGLAERPPEMPDYAPELASASLHPGARIVVQRENNGLHRPALLICVISTMRQFAH